MNSEVQNRNKGNLYLVLLIISLLLFILSASVLLFVVAIPFSAVTKLDMGTLEEALVLFDKYFDITIKDMETGITWAEYVQDYFNNDPILFENIKTLYCAIQFVSYIPVLVIIIYFLREDFVRDFKSFKKDVGRNLKIIGLSFIGMYVLMMVVSNIYDALKIEGSSVNENTINLLLDSPGKWLMILSVTVLAPIVEEVIFRKLMIDTCEVKFRLHPAIVIAISTLIFSLIHVSDIESLKFIFQYIALALPICLAYHYSNNNIFVTIIVHVINNLLSVLMVTVIWMI